jgi:hypothetical protein
MGSSDARLDRDIGLLQVLAWTAAAVVRGISR